MCARACVCMRIRMHVFSEPLFSGSVAVLSICRTCPGVLVSEEVAKGLLWMGAGQGGGLG